MSNRNATVALNNAKRANNNALNAARTARNAATQAVKMAEARLGAHLNRPPPRGFFRPGQLYLNWNSKRKNLIKTRNDAKRLEKIAYQNYNRAASNARVLKLRRQIA